MGSLTWPEVRLPAEFTLNKLLMQSTDLLNDSYSSISGHHARIHFCRNAKPIYCQPGPMPCCLSVQMEEKVGKLKQHRELVDDQHCDQTTLPLQSLDETAQLHCD